ncbi:Iron uptake system component EfeO precursor [Vibrio aerogenes CECT 7868]|uniref:Iron uptake system component EfeO n=1 Tax=Vibrio aerogenes CECT 7868 TaxID=1216006 RepID=A0A1M5ZUR9_9VIBR|nr:iron uptake system protein EfeO [Vibrio aerogenes]SHI27908.1 Iron uptake system component EfeO precursor [Vibrio aerogenes CECT 7868]
MNLKSRKSFLPAMLLLISAPYASAAQNTSMLVEPMTEYKLYVIDEVNELVRDTQAFAQAFERGDLKKAEQLYAPARIHYERIEPVAELFSDLDASIDAREDDYEKGVNDPKFTGFHRLEYAIWHEKSNHGMQKYAQQLVRDVKDLQQRLTNLAFPPNDVVDGAAGLIEEVASSKISGEEDRYSRTDLWDFQANVDGSKKIVDLLRPTLKKMEPAFLAKIDKNFHQVDSILARYRQGEGFMPYENLTKHDRKALQGPVTTLAEDLSQLRGIYGLK